MQPEEGYLWEASQLMHAIIESDNLDLLLRARFTLDTQVYPRMSDYGFKSKEEVRQSVHYWRSQQPDPTKEMRSDRLERWTKDGMTKYEKESLDSVKSGNGIFKEQGNVLETLKSVWDKWLGKDEDSRDDFERD